MQRVTIIGAEGSKGIGGKSGKPYDMGRIYLIARLAPPMGDGIAFGSMGTEIQTASSEVVARIKHLPTPFEADCDIQTVMRFGKPEQICYEVKPVALAPADSKPKP